MRAASVRKRLTSRIALFTTMPNSSTKPIWADESNVDEVCQNKITTPTSAMGSELSTSRGSDTLSNSAANNMKMNTTARISVR